MSVDVEFYGQGLDVGACRFLLMCFCCFDDGDSLSWIIRGQV